MTERRSKKVYLDKSFSITEDEHVDDDDDVGTRVIDRSKGETTGEMVNDVSEHRRIERSSRDVFVSLRKINTVQSVTTFGGQVTDIPSVTSCAAGRATDTPFVATARPLASKDKTYHGLKRFRMLSGKSRRVSPRTSAHDSNVQKSTTLRNNHLPSSGHSHVSPVCTVSRPTPEDDTLEKSPLADTQDSNSFADTQDNSSFAEPQVKRPVADTQDSNSFADSRDNHSFADTRDNNPFADTQDNSSFADTQVKSPVADTGEKDHSLYVVDPESSLNIAKDPSNVDVAKKSRNVPKRAIDEIWYVSSGGEENNNETGSELFITATWSLAGSKGGDGGEGLVTAPSSQSINNTSEQSGEGSMETTPKLKEQRVTIIVSQKEKIVEEAMVVARPAGHCTFWDDRQRDLTKLSSRTQAGYSTSTCVGNSFTRNISEVLPVASRSTAMENVNLERTSSSQFMSDSKDPHLRPKVMNIQTGEAERNMADASFKTTMDVPNGFQQRTTVLGPLRQHAEDGQRHKDQSSNHRQSTTSISPCIRSPEDMSRALLKKINDWTKVSPFGLTASLKIVVARQANMNMSAATGAQYASTVAGPTPHTGDNRLKQGLNRKDLTEEPSVKEIKRSRNEPPERFGKSFWWMKNVNYEALSQRKPSRAGEDDIRMYDTASGGNKTSVYCDSGVWKKTQIKYVTLSVVFIFMMTHSVASLSSFTFNVTRTHFENGSPH